MGKCELPAPKGTYVGTGHEELPASEVVDDHSVHGAGSDQCQQASLCISQQGELRSVITTHFDLALPIKALNNFPCYLMKHKSHMRFGSRRLRFASLKRTIPLQLLTQDLSVLNFIQKITLSVTCQDISRMITWKQALWLSLSLSIFL